MDISLVQLAWISLILFSSSVLQGVVGFASALFGVPLLLLAGLPLPQAVTVILVAAVAQTITGTYNLRREVPYREALRPMLIRLVALPLGGLTLFLLADTVDRGTIKQVIGGLLLVIVAVQCLWRVQPRPRLHPASEWLAFGSAGFLLGFSGMGGPPMVLWVMAHDWSAARSRAFMFFVLFSGMIPHALMLWLLFGDQFLQAAVWGLIGIPAVLAGTALGLWLGHGLPKTGLKRLSYAVLAMIGISAVLSPVILPDATTDRPPSVVEPGTADSTPHAAS